MVHMNHMQFKAAVRRNKQTIHFFPPLELFLLFLIIIFFVWLTLKKYCVAFCGCFAHVILIHYRDVKLMLWFHC